MLLSPSGLVDHSVGSVELVVSVVCVFYILER